MWRSCLGRQLKVVGGEWNWQKQAWELPYQNVLKLELTDRIKVLSGGLISRNISYYFYFFLAERGEVAGIKDAFIMFNNLFRTELGVSAGQFQVSDPLFKRELRLTKD